MTSNHAGSPDSFKADDPQASGSKSDYAVGYARPPKHTQFQPGQSGNPRGRPKRQRNVRTVLEETLNQRITVREGDRTRSVTKLDGVILTLVSGAAKGNPRAQASLITLFRSLGMTGETPEATHQEPLTADDDAIIADFLRRRGAELPRSEMEEHDSASTSTSTPLSERKS